MADDQIHDRQHDDEQQHWVDGDAKHDGKDRDQHGDDYVKSHTAYRAKMADCLTTVARCNRDGCLAF
jgi:hypothetical protein